MSPLTRERAFEILGLLPGAVGPGTVRRAAAARMMEIHPDTAQPGASDSVTIEQIQAARDLLVVEQHTLPCTFCKGRGKVMVGMAPRDCVACDGTGERL